MLRLEITIALGNDAMQSGGDVCDAIDRAIDSSGTDAFVVGERGVIFDANGNRVGAWIVRAD